MCGIFAVFNAEDAASVTRLGLHAQQHRAVEYAGMVTSDGDKFYRHARPGLALQVFGQEEISGLRGRIALGHIRYSTVEDDPFLDNTQPIMEEGIVAIAHNGNLTNTQALRFGLPLDVRLETSMDTELILRRFCLAQGSTVERIGEALKDVRGTATLVFLFLDRLIAVRDPSDNRPLSLGVRGESYFIASETCAFDAVGARTIRDVEPGEIVVVSDAGLASYSLPNSIGIPKARCRFEAIYYAFPASTMFGEEVSDFRFRLGQKLEEVCPAPAEVVVGVPDSATLIAHGYGASERSGKFAFGILRSHYGGRSFVQKGQASRSEVIETKFQVVRRVVAGRDISLVDDSIVRLNTMPRVVSLLRRADVRSIHVRIGCPRITDPCRYGIDTPTKQELAASSLTDEQMCERIGADSLEFLPLEALRELAEHPDDFCYACMTGTYPIPLE